MVLSDPHLYLTLLEMSLVCFSIKHILALGLRNVLMIREHPYIFILLTGL